jgi:hypothetical protein
LKKYYRLSELKDAFGISYEDVNYLNSETDISFCLYCKTTKIVLGGYQEGKFCAFGKANYSGLISMKRIQQTKVFETNKVSITQSTILQKDKVTQYSFDNPFGVELPNKVLKGWYSTPFDKIQFDKIPFCFYPEERKSLLKQFYKMIDEFPDNDNKISLEPLSFYEPDKPITKELFDNWQSFTFDDVCIISDELIKARTYLSDNSPDTLEDHEHSVRITNTSNRPIDVLLTRLLKHFPADKPANVWEKLKDDLNKEPRILDIDEIIDEIDLDTLYWFDDNSEIKTIKKKSFYNLINKLKIN